MSPHEMISYERRLLDPDVRSDRDAVDRLLHPAFTEIGASGKRWSRAEILDAMNGWEHVDVVVSEVETTPLGPDLVQLTYVSDTGATRARRSSIWQRDHRGWRIRFHQGTPLPQASDGDT